ncbi:MAG: AMP-binding protein [Spirochaetes bacterium]|nr:AMP-binding protein [Spirochaetota bacterium]
MCGQQFTYNLYELFLEKALKFPDRIMMYYNGISIRFKEALQNVHKTAHALRVAGVHSGSTVILQSGNTPYFIYCYFAILQCNGIPVLVNPLARQYELQYYCSVTLPACVITDSKMAERLLDLGVIQDHQKFITLDTNSAFTSMQSIIAGESLYSNYDQENSSDAAIIFTSAMDGYALGAVLTHYGIFQSAKSVAQMIPEYAAVFVAVLPLFHAFGLTSSLFVPLIKNLPIELVDKFSPKKIARILTNREIKCFVGVPAMYSIMKAIFERDFDFSHIQLWVSGGDYLSGDLQEWYLQRGVDIRQGYGLTEASPIVSWNMPDIKNKKCSIGKPMPYNEVRIVDENGKDVPTTIAGEIIVKGMNVIEKYYNNPAKTGEYIKDGWLYTGDLGYYDNEGYLFISGRKKDMVLKNGYNVYPKEVERLLLYHPDIASVRISGHVHFLGDSTHEWLVARIKPKKAKRLSSEDIRLWCADNISVYKIPDEIIIE